ncbi:UvrD-helicase domain-containing protein [Candidatus Peregrinibacteria bacterium]|nr:UvrD-helicase domain-containing protein [Candidatus Peregrinibacteria bacterium]
MSKLSLQHPILQQLNPEQQRAVEHRSGPLLIIAGAGSGKTRALIHRIARLMEQGVPPWQILAVTFTNKAANEMKERIKNLLANSHRGMNLPPSQLPTMGTFHSICARILRRDIDKIGRDRKFVIYDSDDQERLMKEVLKECRIDETELKSRAALGCIGRFKCEALSPKKAELQATTDRMHKVTQAYVLYQKKLHASSALDFDDLILETVRLFCECPEVLDRYQETWRYLHVDEYQDTNHSQYLLLSLLAKKYRNICVIGDPDQSIYAFRGADIRNILEFQKDYPDATRIILEQNYRSVQPILTAADRIIIANPNRPQKKMWTDRKEGPKVLVFEVADEHKEAEEALLAIERLQSSGIPLNDQVILYRTNAQSRLFEETCMRMGLPYRIIGGFKFYARKEVKDLLAYLRVILNPLDTISLLRILNTPSRKIGLTTMEHMQNHSVTHALSLWDTLCSATKIDALNEGTKNRIFKFTEVLSHAQERSSRLPVSELTLFIINETNMESWLRDGTDEGEERWQNMQELLSVMRKYDHLEPNISLTAFLEEVSLISEVDRLEDLASDAVTLMTLHLCKGLEFEHVIIAGCEEGILPHGNALFDRTQLEEERRLLYVGMTRAKTYLKLFFTRARMLWGKTESRAPSRFLADLPDSEIEKRSDNILSVFGWSKSKEPACRQAGVKPKINEEVRIEFKKNVDFLEDDINQDMFNEGSRVSHASFGNGTVMNRRGNVADIEFDDGTRKTFALSIAPLKPLQ